MRPSNRWLLCSLLLLSTALTSRAFAEEDTWYYDDGEIHFEVSPSLLISSTELRRAVDADGRVEVITIRAIDPRTHEISSDSYAAITVFRSDLSAGGGMTSEERALNEIVAAFDAAFLGHTESIPGGALSITGERLSSVGRRVTLDDAEGEFRAAVLDTERGSIVFSRFDVSGESLRVFGPVFSSFGLGPAPSQEEEGDDPQDEPEDTARPGEGDEGEHDDDDHHDHDH